MAAHTARNGDERILCRVDDPKQTVWILNSTNEFTRTADADNLRRRRPRGDRRRRIPTISPELLRARMRATVAFLIAWLLATFAA